MPVKTIKKRHIDEFHGRSRIRVTKEHIAHFVMDKEGDWKTKDCDDLLDTLENCYDTTIENDGIGAYEYWGRKGFDRGNNYLILESQEDVTLILDFPHPIPDIENENMYALARTMLECAECSTIIAEDHNLEANFELRPSMVTHTHHGFFQKIVHWFMTGEWWSDRLKYAIKFYEAESGEIEEMDEKEEVRYAPKGKLPLMLSNLKHESSKTILKERLAA